MLGGVGSWDAGKSMKESGRVSLSRCLKAAGCTSHSTCAAQVVWSAQWTCGLHSSYVSCTGCTPRSSPAYGLVRPGVNEPLA